MASETDEFLLPQGRNGFILDAVVFVIAVIVSILPSIISVQSLVVYPFIAGIIVYWAIRLLQPSSISDIFVKLDIKPLSKKDYVIILGLTGFSVALEFGLQIVYSLFFETNSASHSIARQLDFTDPLIFLGLPVFFFLFVAPLEELIFRQGLQRRLLSRYLSSAGGRVLSASVVFALLHFADYSADTGTVLALGTIYISSLILGFSYEYTDNLSYPIVIHGLSNTIASVLLTLTAFNII